ncbi:MAG: hypothetical protein JKX99_09580 [Robiginitomaculum sp.]|nr:hypothetical protein [Robiginitomaculum sp.]
MLALKAISSYPNLFSGAFIQAMACDFRSKRKSEKTGFDIVVKSHLLVDNSINNLSYLYSKKEPNEYDNCDTIIAPHQKVYLIHGKDDKIAPASDIERFLSQQDDTLVQGFILENMGHDISHDMMYQGRTQKAITFWEAE